MLHFPLPESLISKSFHRKSAAVPARTECEQLSYGAAVRGSGSRCGNSLYTSDRFLCSLSLATDSSCRQAAVWQNLFLHSTSVPHHLGEGRGCSSEGEGGGQGGGVAPGDVVIVGVEEVVPPPAVAGEHLAGGRL